MKLHRFIILSFALSALLPGCNKSSDDTDTTPSLEGTLTLSPIFDKYSAQGAEYIIVPSGASLPAGDTVNTVGYYWYLSSSSSVKDTSRIWDVVLPSDTLGTVTLYGNAYASGYYIKTATTTTTIVNDNLNGTGSITGFEIRLSDPFIEGPGGRPYYYTAIGDVQWLRQNMADTSCGTAYMNSDVTSYIFGRYYTWEEALNVCPQGWRLPTYHDWEAVHSEYPNAGDLMADVAFNGTAMWEYWPKVKITDASRLSIIPSGYATLSGGVYIFQGRNDYASFWTATEDSENTDNAYIRYIFEDRNELFTASMSKTSFAASVRCIRDIPTSN